MSSADHLYRHSTLGTTLDQTLEDLVLENKITGASRIKLMDAFDKAVLAAFKEVTVKMNFKNKNKGVGLPIYRNVDLIWTFVLPHIEIHVPPEHVISAEKVKIVCVDAAQKKK